MRRNWLAVARRDAADATRSWLLYALTGLLVAMFGVLVFGYGLTYEPPLQPPDEPPPPDTPHTVRAFGQVASTGAILVPLVALVVGYLAVAGEREAGSLRLLLGHPVTRRDVFAGKALGRVAVVSTSLLVALGIAGLGLPPLYRGFDAAAYAAFVGMVLLLGVAFVCVAVGISAAARSRGLAMGGAITAFVGTTIAWDAIPLSLHYLLHGGAPQSVNFEPDPVPGWFMFLYRLRPQRAFEDLARAYAVPMLPGREASELTWQYTVEGADPFYTEPWFGLVVLLLWVAVPLAVGYWRFRGADLG